MPLPNFDSILAQIAYPGDTPKESDVLRAWLKDHGVMYDSIEFNVHLGTGALVEADIAPEFRGLMRRWTQLRADAILKQGERATIVEVKQRGLPNAMGQLLAYRLLYMAEHPRQQPPAMLLVTASCTEEVIAIFRAHGADVAIVEPLTPEEAV